jgi:polyphosphate kinase 2
MKKREYEKKLRDLQVKLTQMQTWVTETGYRAIVIFEGRDAAGKGGVIKAISQRVSPRVFRVVALPAPSDREKTQIYIQRYINHFPAAGEIVIFDRSWYNRAGVEVVMGFCTKRQRDVFLDACQLFEREFISDNLKLIKYWLEVSPEEQRKRFESRVTETAKNWKLSGMDLESHRRWYDYSLARDMMLDATDTAGAPWNIVNNTDKRKGRLNCIAHFLSQIPYEVIESEPVKLPERSKENEYNDHAPMKRRKYIPERY